MSYLNTLNVDELQELIDISTNDPNEKSNILQSLNDVLRLKQQNDDDDKDKNNDTMSSGIIESLNNNKTNNNTQNNSKQVRKKVSSLIQQINEAERQYLRNELKISKPSKKKIKPMIKKKKMKKIIPKTKKISSAKNVKDLYQTNPQTFYFQSLIKQSISDAVKIEQLKTEIQSIKQKLEIQSKHYHSELRDTKTTEYGLEQNIKLLQTDKIQICQQLSCLTEKCKNQQQELEKVTQSKHKIKNVLEKIVLNNQTQKEEYQQKLANQEKINKELRDELNKEKEKHKQQIELYNRAQLITNTDNVSLKKSVSKQTKRLNDKIKSLEKENGEFANKYQRLYNELEESNAKNFELRRKHKNEMEKIITECREYQLQFQGALRKMEYMVDEKKEIAHQFQKKCQFIEKLQNKILSQEKMLRNLRTNMQSISKQNTKDAIQTKIKQLMKLSQQWDNINLINDDNKINE